MRLWSLHPELLDSRGLVALWREGLLARAVLQGRTRGYRHHPQLDRFRAAARPFAVLNTYLRVVYEEAVRRGYRFDRRKLGPRVATARIPLSRGQLACEWSQLRRKRRQRGTEAGLRGILPRPHPLFRVVPGPRAPWERSRS